MSNAKITYIGMCVIFQTRILDLEGFFFTAASKEMKTVQEPKNRTRTNFRDQNKIELLTFIQIIKFFI